MAKTKARAKELEVEQDLTYQYRKWIVERVAWVVFALLILAALAGLLGDGPLSNASTSNPGGSVTIEYNRFLHFQAPGVVKVRVAPDLIDEGTVRIWFDQDYLSGVKLDKVVPEPKEVQVGERRYTFIFQTSGKDGPLLFVFHLTPETVGLLSGKAGVGEEGPLHFDQFVYP